MSATLIMDCLGSVESGRVRKSGCWSDRADRTERASKGRIYGVSIDGFGLC